MKNIEKILEPFSLSLGKKQDLGTLLIHLRDNEVTMDEVIDYIEGLKKDMRAGQEKREKEQTKWNSLTLKCPECNTIMQLTSVNTHPGNQVGEDLKSQWFCPKCFYDEYSEKTISEQIKELGR